ncbi:MAG: transposase [Patescibacteria group bacterium]|nr:transposase [Patescibacteria group bacterium]
MKEFSKGCQIAYDYSLKHNIYSWKRLHQETYEIIRKKTKLTSQLSCKCVKTAIETGRGCKWKKVDFSKELSIKYDQRSYSFDFKGKCSLSSIKGRKKFVINIPKYYTKYSEWDIKSSTLVNKSDILFLHVVVSKEVQPPTFCCLDSQIVGVDLGINNLAVTSQFDFFTGVKHKLAKIQRLRSILQSKGTKSAKRHLKRLKGKQKRFMRDVNHCISKHIVNSRKAGDIIVMEKLKGIRNKRRGKTMNRLLSNWAFYQLKSFIEYKAIRNGIWFMTLSPAYTSKTCSRCGSRNTKRPKNRGFFKCSNCGYSLNADLNASNNIRKRVKPLVNTLGLSVNQPIVGLGDFHNHSSLTSQLL